MTAVERQDKRIEVVDAGLAGSVMMMLVFYICLGISDTRPYVMNYLACMSPLQGRLTGKSMRGQRRIARCWRHVVSHDVVDDLIKLLLVTLRHLAVERPGYFDRCSEAVGSGQTADFPDVSREGYHQIVTRDFPLISGRARHNKMMELSIPGYLRKTKRKDTSPKSKYTRCS